MVKTFSFIFTYRAGLRMGNPSMVDGLHCRKAVDTSPPSKDLNFRWKI